MFAVRKRVTNDVGKNAAAVVRIHSHCKEEVVEHVQQKSTRYYPCFYPCPSVLDIFVIGKRVNHGGKDRLEIPANFQFYGPEKSINLT